MRYLAVKIDKSNAFAINAYPGFAGCSMSGESASARKRIGRLRITRRGVEVDDGSNAPLVRIQRLTAWRMASP